MPPRVLAQRGRVQAGGRRLGVGVGVQRQHVVADVVLDERQRAARGRVVGVHEPARPERPVEDHVVADHRVADPVDELRSARRPRALAVRLRGAPTPIGDASDEPLGEHAGSPLDDPGAIGGQEAPLAGPHPRPMPTQTPAGAAWFPAESVRSDTENRRYQIGIIEPMAMTLRLSDEQTEALRRRAAIEDRSMQQIALRGPRRLPRARRGRRAHRPPRRAGRATLRRAAPSPRRVTRYLTVEQSLRIARSQSVDRSTCATSDCSRPPSTGRARAFSARTPTPICRPRPPPSCTHWRATIRSSTATSASPGSRRTCSCAKNGVELDADDDAAYDLVIAVASGSLDEIQAIAATLTSFVRTVE